MSQPSRIICREARPKHCNFRCTMHLLLSTDLCGACVKNVSILVLKSTCKKHPSPELNHLSQAYAIKVKDVLLVRLMKKVLIQMCVCR
jgi:hypothetical protein